MSVTVPLLFLAAIYFPIAFVVTRTRFGKTANLLVVMLASGLFSSAPWFALWALARLNRQHCPSVGPCRLDGMQMMGEVVFMLATPVAFAFGAVFALVLALLMRK